MILQFLFVGGSKEAWMQEFESEYREKIAYHYKVDVLRLRPTKEERSRAESKRNLESEILLSKIKPNDFLVVFDERGENLTSIQFSKKMESWLARGKSRIVFCVGGAFGFNDAFRSRADVLISLSTFVFNHHVAQAVVLEQVYRAVSIQKNLPYHNEG